MVSRNTTAMVMAIAAGVLLLVSGMNGLGLWETVKAFVTTYIIDHIAIQLIFEGLILIASLGGVSVIIGGLLIGRSRLTTGNMLIALGTGMGFIGLAVSIAIDYESGNFSVSKYYSLGSVGIILSIAARMVSGKSKQSKEESRKEEEE